MRETIDDVPRKRRMSVGSGDEQEMKVDNVQVEATSGEQQVEDNGREEEKSIAHAGDGDHDDEEIEEETLVVLELCDFKNHPLFDDYSLATLEGIDTATPMLRIGEYILHGRLEETVGTSYFYDTDTTRTSDKTYQYAGQTIKKIKFTIAPPEEF